MLLTFAALAAWSQAPAPAVPAAAQAVPLDPVAAARAWINTLPVAQRAKTNAQFEGGYWIALIGIGLTPLFGSLALTAVYAVIRRAPCAWWLRDTAVLLAFSAFGALI